MKQIVVWGLMLLLIVISCDEVGKNESVDNWTPPSVTNLNFSPKKLKCGDELTVIFTVSNIIGDERAKAWNSVSLNDFKITDSYDYIGNNIVCLNLNIPENIKPLYNTAKNGEKEVIFEYLDESNFENILNPNKYTYFKVNGNALTKEVNVELRCIVPENTKSTFIKIQAGNTSDSGFSEEKLIIVDENGTEITE